MRLRLLAISLLIGCPGPANSSDSATETVTSAATTTTGSTTTTTGEVPTTGTLTTTSASTGGSLCGNGAVDGGEVCDDGEAMTQLGEGAQWPLMYGGGACMGDCSLELARCGDGVVDPGEACDDGDGDSTNACTTSCTVNDGGYHTPCQRACEPLDCDPADVHEGTITGCEAVVPPAGGEVVCLTSGTDSLVDLRFAEGDCAAMAQRCAGQCPAYLTFGDYDNFGTCPEGTALAQRTTRRQGATIFTRVCHRACDSDADCRWNAVDGGAPGQYRCQATADTAGARVCVDGRN